MSANPAMAAEPRPPTNDAEMRAALEWETGQKATQEKSTWEWLWEAIQGDFNENRSTGQIAFDAGIAFIPVIDQICDVRDIIANCRSIAASDEKDDNTWKWVALALTLIGLFPSLGSLVKGVLKIMFNFVRKLGLNQLVRAVNTGMNWVVIFLRKKEVQDYLRRLKVDNVFQWLAKSVRELQGKVNTGALLRAFDGVIGVIKGLLDKVTWIPKVGARAKQALAMVEKVRAMAPKPLAKVDEILQKIFDTIARRLEMEHMLQRHGIVDASNFHFRGTLPEDHALTLMRETKPAPAWLSKGRARVTWAEMDPKQGREIVDRGRAKGWCDIDKKNIASFHKLTAVEIKGPAKLYRVVSPSNGAMGDCWITEDVWQKIISAPDPKAAWRKYLAVWPDWNPNGQFVMLEVKAGESLKVWRGPASSQVKDPQLRLDAHLEGGWDQVIFKPKPGEFDTTRYYKRGGKDEHRLQRPISREEFAKLPKAEQAEYTAMRERINHPGIKGPFDTGWGSTDFDEQLTSTKIGLPNLPGQVTN